MQILAATDFSTRSNRALRQAGLLAQPGNAQLHVVHVVDEDRPEELVSMEKREAERVLNEQTRSMPELSNVQTRLMVVTGDPNQSDLLPELSGLGPVAERLEAVGNIAVVRLADRDIVRHPLVADMLGVL